MKNKITSFQKFRILLWKNFLLEWNQKIALALEIIVPVLFCIIIVLLRLYDVPSMQSERRYPPVEINDLSRLWVLTEDLPHIVAYSPKNQYIDNIIKDASESLSLTSYEGFSMQKELECVSSVRNFTAAIQFPDAYSQLLDYPQKLEFAIQFPSLLRTALNWENKHPRESIWSTDRVRNPYPLPAPYKMDDADGGVPAGYIREGFIQIQHAVTMSYIKLVANNEELPEIVMRRTPYPPFMLDGFLSVIIFYLPFLLALGYMASALNIARYIAQEKENQLKEIMKIMGVPNWIHWLAWFVRSFLVLSLVSLFFVLILKIPVIEDVAVFNNSNWMVLLLLFLVWSISVICFSFMMAVFFDQTITAVALTGLVYFLLLIPLFFMYAAHNDLNVFLESLVCLNLNFAQAIAINHICYMEGIGEGVQWSNLFKALNEDESLSLGVIMIMMVVSACLYMLICLYVEQVMPGRIGVPKKWYFPLKCDFWCAKRNESEFMMRKSAIIERDKPEAFEQEPRNGRVGVEIKALGKRFDDKWVVKNLSLNMLEDEITVLLGHNGAGKTTTISMLTGILPPTAGTAYINGCDIRTNLDGARASMGICPQHNVLFDDMSVANHLIFFTKLKGFKGRAVKIEVERFLEIMQLKQQANDLPKKLAGGMKRKLSLCCALCGDSKVVFCDEPSSGMDPAARRQLWDLLQSEKAGRTVLLTTHFMDEADVLGDRMAIMSNGELKCHGTSFFLKKKFGSGYRLTCVKTAKSNVVGLTNLLGKYIEDIKPESDVGSELTYSLPDQFSYIFGEMLQELEKKIKILGFREFGIGVTSLEEVFMKFGAENADPDMLQQAKTSNHDTLGSVTSTVSKGIEPTAKAKTDGKRHRLKKAKLFELFDKEDKEKEVIKRSVQIDNGEELPKIITEENKKAERDNESKSTLVSANEEDGDSNIHRSSYKKMKGNSDPLEDTVKNQNVLRRQESVFRMKVKHEQKFERPAQRLLQRAPSPTKAKVAFNEDSGLIDPYAKLESSETHKSKGSRLICDQLRAMLYKKMKYTLRNFVKVLFQNTLGVVFVFVAIISAREYNFKPLPPMTFSLTQYSQAVIVLEVNPNINPTDKLEYNTAVNYQVYFENYSGAYKLESTNGVSFEDYFLQLGNDKFVDMNKDYLGGATINNKEITAWFNNQVFHAAPLALNLVHNAIARTVIGPHTEITVINYPLPFKKESEEKNIVNSKAGENLAQCLGFSTAIATAFYAIFIIKENSSGYKLIQYVSGLRIPIFWLTHFLWDFFMMLVVSFRIMLSIFLLQEPGYTTLSEISRYSLLLAVFSFSVPPWTYVLAGFFKDPVIGFMRTSFFFIFTGIALVIFYGPIHASGIGGLEHGRGDLKFYYIFIFLPHFSFTLGWRKLDVNTRRRIQCEDESLKSFPREMICELAPYCCREPVPYFAAEYPGILLELLAMTIGGIALLSYLIARDYGFSTCLNCEAPKKYEANFQYEEMDEDVKVERERVMNMKEEDIATYRLVLDRLAKFYGYRIAVNYISLSIKGKECFGLLGINGAGKTTTFKMLTGNESISSGDAYVMGISVRNGLARVYRSIGYCPQYDALQEDLTGRETLFVFCLIRGVPRSDIKAVSEGLAEALGFTIHLDKKIRAYSAGNKRKLSSAIALLGAPSVIYLDEPTSSMDPASQRKLWNMICLTRDSGKMVMLTTHSMGEVEALCTRAAIMVNGSIKCLGSIQHLKSRFLKGLVLKIQVERLSEPNTWTPAGRLSLDIQTRVNDTKMEILTKYPRAVVRSVYQNLITIYIPLVGIKWSEIFSWLEENRYRLKIEEYFLSQTPLDEVFLEFARQ